MTTIAPVWNATTGAPSDVIQIVVGGPRTLALTSTGALCEFDFGSSTWMPWSSAPETFVHIAAAADGSMIAVSTSGQVYLNNGSGVWSLAVMSTAVSVAIADANHYALVDASGLIHLVEYGISRQIASGPTHVVAGSSLNSLVGIDDAGFVVAWDASTGTWFALGAGQLAALDLVAGTTDGAIGVNFAGEGYRWTGTTWAYIIAPLSGLVAMRALTFDTGSLTYWAVGIDGVVYQGY